ncbi:hypothetical protein KY312_03475, partial [Candidatus Woesearchaeota archaeon]|nr:hypothetical protein [Candidatus Woesearchaeota archaeon]
MMKAFVCDVCGFCSIDGTQPDKCPVCTNTTFTENDNAISEPQDKDNLNELEKKHIPVIKINKQCQMNPAECQNAVIIVGEIIHPMEENHHIV